MSFSAVRPSPPVGRRLELVGRDRHGVDGPQGAPQALEVPVLGEALGGLGVDVALDDVVDEEAQLLVEVLALEDAAALVVDDGALAVEDVVVLEDVLADLEVLRLDLRLRRLDRARDELGLDRLVVLELRGRHDPVDEAGVEQPHEVVLEREVEARLARVTLAAGTTAQLVVDAARLVALGAEDVQAAELGDLVVLGRHVGLGRGQRLVPRRLVLLGRLVGVEAAGLEVGDGPELGVATEHDVGASTGHVRRDGDGALAAGVGDDRPPPARGAWR